MRRVRFGAIALAAWLAVGSFTAQAQVPESWVGSWYTETKEDKVYAGAKYDLRRQLIVNRRDKSKTNIFRFYAAGQLVGEATATYQWGVDKDLYWTICQTMIRDQRATACSDRQEYDVVSVTPRELRYRSRKSGVMYSVFRVGDDFKLP